MSHSPRNGYPQPYSRISRPEPPSSFSIEIMRLNGPIPDIEILVVPGIDRGTLATRPQRRSCYDLQYHAESSKLLMGLLKSFHLFNGIP
jgi:hypothetical protein